MSRLTPLFWLALAAVSAYVLVRAGSDYLDTLVSFQDFRWGIAGFAAPAADATDAVVTLEVQNRSRLDLDFKDLEVYLWLNGATVGKSYGRFEARTVSAHSSVHIPVTIQLDPNQLRDAVAAQVGASAWSITATYKATAPFVPTDFEYHLRLDVGP